MDCSRLLELQGRYPFDVTVVDEADSTNRLARELAELGCSHGTTVLAKRQTDGKGRLGRSWLCPEGANLMFSTVLRPALGPNQVALVCLGAAVAVCRAVPVPIHVKWPNDILDAGWAKLGGILAEAEFQRGELQYLVLGVGLNIEAAPDSVPHTSCLSDLGFEVKEALGLCFNIVNELLWVTSALETDSGGVLDQWRGYSMTLGANVRIGDIEGTAVDIGNDGALVVRSTDGQNHRILAGDVEMVSSSSSRS